MWKQAHFPPCRLSSPLIWACMLLCFWMVHWAHCANTKRKICSPSGLSVTFLLQPRSALNATWLHLLAGWCQREFLLVHSNPNFHQFSLLLLFAYISNYRETKLQKIVHFQRSKHHFQRKLINFQVHWRDNETGRDALSASYTKADYRWGKSSLDCLFDQMLL